MAAYSAEDVVRLFEDDGPALDALCMDGSDDELGVEEIEVVQNPYHHHVPEFDEFEVIEGKIVYSIRYYYKSKMGVWMSRHTALAHTQVVWT